MDTTQSVQLLLRKSLVAATTCSVLVLVCYLFVDRPVAFWVYNHGLSEHVFLKWLTYPPPILQTWTPVILTALVVRRACGPFCDWEQTVVAACVSLILADQFRESLSYAFGRDWPETWIENNPSLIRDGAYGFHPFRGGEEFGSFPSGHAARTLAVATVVWIRFPRWRWACTLASIAIAAGLLGMNYHFVGDVVAGGFVGAIVGAWTAEFTGPRSTPDHQ
ncbi:MAG: phosphatase PAP2 family protein [Planctomycetaceae bacterium]|nr:phosphatase PAP2 family protein [Planctomycetaceae bacterium]